MKTNIFLNIALRIILIFGIGILMSFVHEHLRVFLGDTKFVPYNNGYFLKDETGAIDVKWEWGARHYWYFWMCVCLFALSLINAVLSIVKLIEKEYPNL